MCDLNYEIAAVLILFSLRFCQSWEITLFFSTPTHTNSVQKLTNQYVSSLASKMESLLIINVFVRDPV